jgi:ribokinase
MADSSILVVGQVGRDLVLALEAVPGAGGSADVLTRRELLGGKGANQAVGMAQLGAVVELLGVVGEDTVGEELLRAVRRDGIGTRWVRRRGTSALLVDVVEADGSSRLLEDVPDESLLTVGDVRAAEEAFARAGTVCLQLQQPPDALAEAARLSGAAGARVVLDGAVDSERRGLLDAASVLRADAHEASLLAGTSTGDPAVAGRLARRLLVDHGLDVVALGVDGGDLVAWPGGDRVYPHATGHVDATGGGDSFLAGLVAGLREGRTPELAGRLAADCAASTVGRLGGRPDLGALRPA